MKIAYLLAVYNNPKHLQRLIRALSSDDATFYVHVNSRSDPNEFAHLKDEPNVRFTQTRHAVYWGDYSLVEAVLILINEALAAPEKFDRFVWLSAAHYPLQSAAYIDEFFRNNPSAEFINAVPMPCEEIGKPIFRLTKYVVRANASPWTKLMVKVLGKMGIIGKRDYKKHLQGLMPYGGDGWWALTRKASQYLVDFIDENPQIAAFYQNTACPDELLFHTILGNSAFKAQMRHTLTYTDWDTDGPHPAFLTQKHLHLFNAESAVIFSDMYSEYECLFARKFSDDSDDLIRDLNKLITTRGAKGKPIVPKHDKQQVDAPLIEKMQLHAEAELHVTD